MIRVNLIGVQRARRRVRAPVVTMEGRSGLIILAVVLVVVVLAQFYRYQSLQDESARLDQEIQRLNQEKTELARVRSEVDTLTQRKELLLRRINIIEGLKAGQTGPVQLLAVLASTVSSTDALWLTAFEQSGQGVTIEGVALNVKAVADFLTRLKSTGMFSAMDLKETSQDTAAKDVTTFVFTFNGQLAAPPLTSSEAGAA